MTTSLIGLDPAHLFIAYYREASGWTGTQRRSAPPAGPAFDDLAAAFLLQDDGQIVARNLWDLVEGKKSSVENRRGRVLALLHCIDSAFLRIHPRQVTFTGGLLPPTWLRDARLLRLATGAYAQNKSHRLIARGPLARRPRLLTASSADQLSDYFSALAVAPTTLDHDGRTISVAMKMIGSSPITGVPPSPRPGSEKVGFLPIATRPGDLSIAMRTTANQSWASYGPADGFDAGAAALEGLRNMGQIDIAIMPELTLSERDIDQIASALRRETMPMPRLIVTGSASTSLLCPDGQAWNECRVLNALGHELWRQRKIWPAGINAEKANRFGLTMGSGDALIMEDNASGGEIVIADIDGFGRCVVLICQDCEMPVATPTLFNYYQPDWVFTPIYDCAIDRGRWVHARTFGLSSLSQARCIAVTHMAFAKRDAIMGIAVGPKESTPDHVDEIDRAVAMIPRPKGTTNFSLIEWRSSGWEQSWLDTKIL